MVNDEDIQPLRYRESVNVHEHKQIVSKLNEVVDAVNTGQPRPTDEVPTKGSRKLVLSGGVFTVVDSAATDAKDALNKIKTVESTADAANEKANFCIERADKADEKITAVETTANLANTKADNALKGNSRTVTRVVTLEEKINATDAKPVQGSDNLVKSGGVYEAIHEIGPGPGPSLPIDEKPTQNSRNLVRSGGVYEAIHDIAPTPVDIDEKPTENSRNLVRSGGVYSSAKIDFDILSKGVSDAGNRATKAQWAADDANKKINNADSEPIKDSGNLVKSGGVYKAIHEIGPGPGPLPPIDTEPKEGSSNLITSGSVYKVKVTADTAKKDASHAYDLADKANKNLDKYKRNNYIIFKPTMHEGCTLNAGYSVLIAGHFYYIECSVHIMEDAKFLINFEPLRFLNAHRSITGRIANTNVFLRFEIGTDGDIINTPELDNQDVTFKDFFDITLPYPPSDGDI